MTLSRNLVAGLISSIWTALLGFAVVPFYLKYLGIEAYGLIGFFVTAQSLMQLLDLGLAPAMNRETARGFASGNLDGVRSLLSTLSVIYWCMGITIFFAIYAIAPFIAKHWLNAGQLSEEIITEAIILMGLVISCRWPIGVYQSTLMGAQRLVMSSALNVSATTVGSLGAIVVLAHISPTIEAFFSWQVLVGIMYAMAVRWASWRLIGRPARVQVNFRELKRILGFSAGMSGVALLTVAFLQLDKVILSKMLSLEEFGQYTLAGVVASGLLVLLTPVFNVIFPRMSEFVAVDNSEALIRLYRSGTRKLTTVLFPLALAGSVSAQDLIVLWTGKPEFMMTVSPIVTLLLVGNAINGVMIFPYALQLANGMTRLPLMITVTLIFVYVPMLTVMVSLEGALGGALAWVSLNVLYLGYGTWITHRVLLRGIGWKWIIQDVLIPFWISVAFVMIGWWVLSVPGHHYWNLAWGAALAILASLAVAAIQFHPPFVILRRGGLFADKT